MTKRGEWVLISIFILAVGIISPAQTFKKLWDFTGTDGGYPLGYFVQGPDGNFYGTADAGGANGNYGAVFRLTPQGELNTIYSFCSQPNCTDGSFPEAGLILASDGNLWGTTSRGGDPTCLAPAGCGTVFKITPGGELTTVHAFELTDGAYPWANLVEAGGSLFGAATAGGDLSLCNSIGCGTIFRISLSGSLTTLHTFVGIDGSNPFAGLVQASNGEFYGTTMSGGNNQCSGGFGCGTVFKITPAGNFASLYTFPTVGMPNAPLIQATDGNLYGTTFDSSIFKVTLSGVLTTLYTFSGGGQFGVGPSGLTQGTDGNLYGPTFSGGDDTCDHPNGCGMLYKLSLNGVLTGLHNFECINGCGAAGALLQSTDGNFYGSTNYGGAYGSGTAFGLSMGLGPFISFTHDSGGTGQTIGILGQGFTGTTNVSFNGTPATFTVRRDTFLTATVPTGATTGYVTVTTPSGTLTSNVQFHVLP